MPKHIRCILKHFIFFSQPPIILTRKSDILSSSTENKNRASGDAGTVHVTLSDDSYWTLTGDSYVTSFDGDLTNVTANGYHLYVNGEQTL